MRPALMVGWLLATTVAAQEEKPPAPKGNYYKSLPKGYARLVALDAAARTIRFVWEKDGAERELPVRWDAELWRDGFWGAPEDYTPGERLWLVIDADAEDRWLSVRTIADGVSIQALFGDRYTVRSWHARAELKQDGGKQVEVALELDEAVRRNAPAVGEKVYFSARRDGERLVAGSVLNAAAFDAARARQIKRHDGRVERDGLAAIVNDVSPVDGRLLLSVRRADTLWARTLKMNEKVRVELVGSKRPAVEAVVWEVRPDYACAKVKLVAEGRALAPLKSGDEARLRPETPRHPDPDVPPDPGRFKERSDRIGWFLSTIYCTCGMPHDG
jgi:hypothetical protein